LTSKFGKIGLSEDPGGQGSSPKDFISRWDMSNELRLRPQKEKSRFGGFWLSQWAFEKPTYLPVVHQGFMARRWSKIDLLEHFIMVSTLVNHFLLEFFENLFPIKFW
jgi:hypothetical protein